MLSRARKLISTLSLCLLLGIGWIIYSGLSFIHKPMIAAEKSPVDYLYEPGSSVFALADDLKKLGLLDHPLYFVALAKWTQLSRQLKAGEYRFLPGIKPLQLLDQLAKGRVLSHQLTIIEGWTFDKMMMAIRKEPKIKQTLVNVPPEIIMAKLAATNSSPEGLFFPDSYRYTRGTTDLAIIQAAYHAMQRYLAIEWDQRAPALPYKSPYEALIVASLIEKETSLASERPLVAGVIVNRLKKNMRLQIDPTIIYGIGDNYKGKLYSSDLKKDSPYNTYLRSGLPPTPIALPSRAAIHAAMHPYEGDYFYFVARGNGAHQFSVTLNEHKQAVQNYIRYKRNAKAMVTKNTTLLDKQSLCKGQESRVPCKVKKKHQPLKASGFNELTNITVMDNS